MSAAPAAAPAPRPHQPGRKLEQFWHRLTEGLKLNELWSQFEKDARTSYRFYSRDLYRAQPAAAASQPGRGTAETARRIFWAIFDKISPARRVVLLLALVLLLLPHTGFTFKDAAGDVQVSEFDMRFWGGLLLFGLLMLEVSD